jgi:nitrite reductase/ring-hydroxylating ferredoxin subunit
MASKRTGRRRARVSRRGARPIRYRVARAAELASGTSLKFTMPLGGIDEECFIVNFGGAFHAYVNRCCHVPIAMDWVDNQFFTADGAYLLCQTHNACYAPASGECVAGPPGVAGKFLVKIPLELSDGIIYAFTPEP